MADIKVDSPPPYFPRHVKSLLDDLSGKGGSRSEKADVPPEKIAEFANDPNVKKDILAEMDKLSELALSIKSSFDVVSKLLKEALENASLNELQERLKEFSEEWETYCQSYNDLLKQSRDTAKKAGDSADEFFKRVIPLLLDDTVSMKQKKEALEVYIKGLDGNADQSKDMSQQYSDLKRNVENFSLRWPDVVQIAEEDKAKLDKELDALNASVAELDEEVERLRAKVKKMKDIIIVAGTCCGCCTALGWICPCYWIPAFFLSWVIGIIGVLLYKARRKLKRFKNKLFEKNGERDKKAKELDKLRDLQATLEKATPSIAQVFETLGKFAEIWAMIRADGVQVSAGLDSLSDMHIPSLFKDMLEATKALYETLAIALRRYEANIGQI
ncbi:hypothetical protein BOTBODRAFT_34814 [Botryobasidium botryosum FD-172 SS1]|uniref:Uncharacterized protein n=1 Tax=Botryobasidium botryosum (strain FD-172 SS1) TaxID=930990 RepID=A0A067MKW3_BOTB1|nr:hypothetical protein BOTBODRAFT_34814 [Botryobasidium botryosum FD-172 SS1]